MMAAGTRAGGERNGRRGIARSLAAFALAGTLAIGLSGCSRIRTHQGYLTDNLLLDSIRPGVDNRASVEGTLGTPTFTTQFNGGEYYYVGRDMKQLAFNNPKPTSQTLIRVRFDEAGNVVAVDRSGLEKVVNVDPKKGKTHTLGRKRTLLEDLFGNIGSVGAGPTGGSGGGGGN